MTDAWSVLELSPTDDVRAVKRAYAAGLKRHRPDEDPVGFQQLTDAYEFALADVRRRAAEALAGASPEPAADGLGPGAPADGGQAGDGTEIAGPSDGPVAADGSHPPGANEEREEGFDFAPFFEEMARKFEHRNPLHLRGWLEAHPALYSIELKWALIPYVFDAVARNAAQLDPHRDHLDALQTFFGIDARLRRHPAVAPALDYLESGQWREAAQPARTPMPAGWENLAETMHERPRAKPRPEPVPRALVFFLIFVLLRVIAALSSS